MKVNFCGHTIIKIVCNLILFKIISESFVVCKNYKPPEGFDPKAFTPYLNQKYSDFNELVGVNRFIVPFIVCGDLSAYDSDMTYALQVFYISNAVAFKYLVSIHFQ